MKLLIFNIKLIDTFMFSKIFPRAILLILTSVGRIYSGMADLTSLTKLSVFHPYVHESG